jgi:hypothetical protein
VLAAERWRADYVSVADPEPGEVQGQPGWLAGLDGRADRRDAVID